MLINNLYRLIAYVCQTPQLLLKKILTRSILKNFAINLDFKILINHFNE